MTLAEYEQRWAEWLTGVRRRAADLEIEALKKNN